VPLEERADAGHCVILLSVATRQLTDIDCLHEELFSSVPGQADVASGIVSW
jgi:hypothetical protein